MLFPGTQMHIVTFLFVCVEVVILFYLAIYKLARPDDKTNALNIVLISLLLVYNVTGGLLPDKNLPGSYFLQEALAYATGFITPCYFPYYVYKAFGLEKMRFHAFRGVFLCLIIPYIAFLIVFATAGTLAQAKNILIIPTAYALWVIFSLNKAVNSKYNNNFSDPATRREKFVLLLSLTPWVGLPIIDYFDLGQAIEASVTNVGFLTLFTFQVSGHIAAIRLEHQRVIISEQRLKNWNTTLQTEVERRTKELAKINEQQMNTFINLAHETKTPLTLVNNYMEEHIRKHGASEELAIVKNSIDKLSADIINLFDLEKFKRGFAVYNHNQVSNFSKILSDSITLFEVYARKLDVPIQTAIEANIFVKADPLSINRIVNNLIENAIKFSSPDCLVTIRLNMVEENVFFSVKNCGPGIPQAVHRKVFEPYYQIGTHKKHLQGMGLGLPIVKKVVDDLAGEVILTSNPETERGTEILIVLKAHQLLHNETVPNMPARRSPVGVVVSPTIEDIIVNVGRSNILVVEDNTFLLAYLSKKLSEHYNVYAATGGDQALRKLNALKIVPDLIITDVMMEAVDGYTFASILAKSETYNHIPFIFLTAKAGPTERLQGLKLGAIDVIQKPFSMAELLQKIQSILANTQKQHRALVETARSLLHKDEFPARQNAGEILEQNFLRYQLTQRERDIAKEVCRGIPYKGIAETMFISEKTVAKHVQNIFEKVGVSNKLELTKRLEEAA